MRTGILGSAVVVGLLLTVAAWPLSAVAQELPEPTVDDRYRDASGEAAEMDPPRLNAPQSNLSQKSAANNSAPAAFLGVTFAGNERAAIVRRVAPGSPAEAAGLQPNDLIETLQGRRIRTNQDVLDIVARMQPGDVLDIGFTRRMSIRTQAPLGSVPRTPRSIGHLPDRPGNLAAPEDPEDAVEGRRRSIRNSTPQNRSSSDERRGDNQEGNQSDQQNRRLFGRGLRLR